MTMTPRLLEYHTHSYSNYQIGQQKTLTLLLSAQKGEYIYNFCLHLYIIEKSRRM